MQGERDLGNTQPERRLSRSDRIIWVSLGSSVPVGLISPPVGGAVGSVGLSILGYRGIRAGYRFVRRHLPAGSRS